MEYAELKRILTECADLRGLDEAASVALFWRGESCNLKEGEVIYVEGEKLDGTFCLLICGDVIIEKTGEIIGGIWEPQIFGEMAYFTRQQARTATVRVGSAEAVIVRFRLSPEELSSERFSMLRKLFGTAHVGSIREHVANFRLSQPSAARPGQGALSLAGRAARATATDKTSRSRKSSL